MKGERKREKEKGKKGIKRDEAGRQVGRERSGEGKGRGRGGRAGTSSQLVESEADSDNLFCAARAGAACLLWAEETFSFQAESQSIIRSEGGVWEPASTTTSSSLS